MTANFFPFLFGLFGAENERNRHWFYSISIMEGPNMRTIGCGDVFLLRL